MSSWIESVLKLEEDNMKKINVLSKIETNSFADSSKANNGGGYSQPLYKFMYNGKTGYFSDDSCGDFGSRYSLEYDGQIFQWGSMLKDFETYYPSETVREKMEEFFLAFEETFGLEIPTYRPENI